jgi:glycosyltransferase involved in cell wall biosynthesis
MIGWEYPPHNSGGLGVACEGLTQALALQNTHIYFTLPYALSGSLSHMQVLNCQVDPSDEVAFRPPFSGYATAQTKFKKFDPTSLEDLSSLPQSEMEERVNAYAEQVLLQGTQHRKKFDIIHAHDWMAFPAAMKLQQKTEKPFIAHVHSTEFDRIPGGHGSHFIMHTEYMGLQKADKVIAVSHLTKRILVDKYFVDPTKIEVVHNGVQPAKEIDEKAEFAQQRPVVVFMGRLTAQKGAEYFLELARSVLQRIPEALFVVAGSGDLYHSLLLKNAYEQLSASVIFGGFMRDKQRELLLQRADVFVMPSLSEPFGLVALEAAQRQTPVLVSMNSGVKEILPGALQADFWDIAKMTDQINDLVHNKDYAHQVVEHQNRDLKEATWDKAAAKIKNVYKNVGARRY